MPEPDFVWRRERRRHRCDLPRATAFNRARIGTLDTTPTRLAAHDDAGTLCGGRVGDIDLGCLAIDVLWVADTLHRQDIGTRLLQGAESRALAHGVKAAFLDTFSWQSEGVYLRHGYEASGRLADFTDGASRVFMRKTLVGDTRAP